MELAVAPLGEDLLGGLGEHLREVREYPGRAPTPCPGLAHPGRGGGRAWRGGGWRHSRGWLCAAVRRSDLVWSAAERYALETVACRSWLGQQPSTGSSRRADRSK
jgi:hypothetical protein